MSLLIVGTVAFDKVETPLGKTEKILGGAGTYIGIAASFQQLKMTMIWFNKRGLLIIPLS